MAVDPSAPTRGQRLVDAATPRLTLPFLLVLAAAFSLVAAGGGVLPGDVAVARAVQRAVLPEGRSLVEGINWLGQAWPGAVALTLFVAALLALRRCYAEALVVAATLPLRLVNPLLKGLVDSPRPTEELVRVIERANGSGFPSGHAAGAVLLYGAVIAVAPRLVSSRRWCLLLRVGAALMILAVGVSRVAVGAHWPSDVLGGYLWGGVLLALLLTVYCLARPRTPTAPSSADDDAVTTAIG